MNNAMLFTGNANVQLATKIAKSLNMQLGDAKIKTFSDGEISCDILSHVRGQQVYVVQPTCAPANNALMELLIMVDAIKRSGAAEVNAIIPYYGYARQDRRPGYARTAITSKLVADMMVTAGINKVITVDIHSEQQQGFFPNTVPLINISASPEIIGDVWKKFRTELFNNDVVAVSPDVGGVSRARFIAKRLDNCELAIIDKRRERANESEVMNLIGSVEGKHCVLVDDMVDTSGTLGKAADALMVYGARSVTAYATHPVLSGNAYKNILNHPSLTELVVMDTIPLPVNEDADARKLVADGRIRILSIARLMSETMRRTHTNQSVSDIYLTSE